MVALRVASTEELTATDLRLIRALVDGAFGAQFSDHDWDHALGGVHVLLESDGVPLSHASVVHRTLTAGERILRTGYVEAVATQAVCRRQGYGTQVMSRINALIEDTYELGALSTGVPGFYERLGWERWSGPTFASAAAGVVRTPEEDDGVVVLRTAATRELDLTSPLTCDQRMGDAW